MKSAADVVEYTDVDYDSVRRVSEYSSSFIDLKDRKCWEMRGVRYAEGRAIQKKWTIITHRKRQGARNQLAYSKELQKARLCSLEGYLAGKGRQKILKLP